MTLGEKLKQARNEIGLSLGAIATDAGCSKSYLWALENNNDLTPSGKKLAKIAQALGLSLDYLLADESQHDTVKITRSRFGVDITIKGKIVIKVSLSPKDARAFASNIISASKLEYI